MKAAAAFILGLSLAVVTTPNPAGEKRIEFFILMPAYHYHGKAVLAFALGLIMPLYVNPFFSVIKPSLLGESS